LIAVGLVKIVTRMSEVGASATGMVPATGAMHVQIADHLGMSALCQRTKSLRDSGGSRLVLSTARREEIGDGE